MRAGRGRKEGSHKGGTGLMEGEHKGKKGGGSGSKGEVFIIRVLKVINEDKYCTPSFQTK